MSPGVEYRRFGPADAALLQRIAPDVFDHPIHPARLAAYLAAPGHLMVLALHEGQVVGQIAGIVHRRIDAPSELYIDNLGVTPALRRQGIARGLVEAVVLWGRELRCEAIWVATETDNLPARALYEGRGWTEESVSLLHGVL